jgi:hypothetical protein
MISSLRNTEHKDHKALCASFDAPLRQIARRAVRVWFNHDRLDQVLAEHVPSCPFCELIYAIDAAGRQVSSNIHANHIDRSAYGQDLSRRPYSVSLAVLNNAAFGGAFVCDAYISQVTQSLCVTVMFGVTRGRTALGFVAADIDPTNLPAL